MRAAAALLLLAATAVSAVASAASDDTDMCIVDTTYANFYLSSKNPYKAPEATAESQVTEALGLARLTGARLTRLAYVGRHASRYSTKVSGCEDAGAILRRSHLFTAWPGCEEDRAQAGSITPRGRREARGLGERFGALLRAHGMLPPEEAAALATMDAHLSVHATWKLRTQQTAVQFLRGVLKVPEVQGAEHDREIRRRLHVTPAEQDTELRFFDVCDTYTDGWSALKHKLNKGALGERARKLFPPIARKLAEDLGVPHAAVDENAVTDLYKHCVYSWVVDDEASREADPHTAELCGMFTPEEMTGLALHKDFSDYYKKGPGSRGIHGYQIACLLLRRMLEDLASARVPPVTLRFGHAETIVPLYTLLHEKAVISQAQLEHDGADPESWRMGVVSPMASNIAFALTDGADVVILHNERVLEYGEGVPECKGHRTCPLASLLAVFPEGECVWTDLCGQPKK